MHLRITRPGKWEIVTLPVGMLQIGAKWVYEIKYKTNGDVDRSKARLSIRTIGL